jgi:hypothetical protein
MSCEGVKRTWVANDKQALNASKKACPQALFENIQGMAATRPDEQNRAK